MAPVVKPHVTRMRWISGEVDANPFMLPARVTIPANETMYRLFGFIRYAVVHKDVRLSRRRTSRRMARSQGRQARDARPACSSS